jgi:general secretion pathway protein A
MYTKYYGLQEKPFEISPDPKFLYLSENHKEALAHLIYAVTEGSGFTVITGEVGTGKTTLAQTLLSRLDGNVQTAYLFNPTLKTDDFIQYILKDLGVRLYGRTKGDYLHKLHQYLLNAYQANVKVILIIDEAQTLNPRLLEEVRLLTNLETSKKKLLQVILLGQPEFNRILDDPRFRQLNQRVSLRYHIQPLNKKETEEYIENRLRRAGASNPYFFSPRALKKIYRYSKGIPRLINTLCDHALLIGYTNDQKEIGPSVIREAKRDLKGPSFWTRKLLLQISVAILILLFVGFLFFVWGDQYFGTAKENLSRGVQYSLDKLGGLFR